MGPADERWKELFEIVDKDNTKDDDYFSRSTFLIVDRHGGSQHGEYRTRKYARRQARYKYRKFIKLIEQKLTS